MRYYESLYIVNPNYEQDRLDGALKTVADKVGEYGFSIINHRVWGKKRLAYSIQKHKYGTFVLLHFETESVENLNRFERFMVLQKPILRNQTVVLETRPEVHVEEESANDETADAVETPQANVETTAEPVVEPAVEAVPKSAAASEEAFVEEVAVEAESTEEDASEVPEDVAGEAAEQAVEAEETEEVQE